MRDKDCMWPAKSKMFTGNVPYLQENVPTLAFPPVEKAGRRIKCLNAHQASDTNQTPCLTAYGGRVSPDSVHTHLWMVSLESHCATLQLDFRTDSTSYFKNSSLFVMVPFPTSHQYRHIGKHVQISGPSPRAHSQTRLPSEPTAELSPRPELRHSCPLP